MTDQLLFFAAVFRAPVFFTVVFFAPVLRAVLFFAAVFFTVVLRAVVFFAVAFFAGVLRAVAFLAVLFLAAAFFAGAFFAVVFLAVVFLAVALLAVVFFPAAFFAGGTLPPSLRASDKPIATACFGLVTFRPELLLSCPRLNSCIVSSTFSWDFLPYRAMAISFLFRKARSEPAELRRRAGTRRFLA